LKRGSGKRKITNIEPNKESPSPGKYEVHSIFDHKSKGYSFASDKNLRRYKTPSRATPGPGCYNFDIITQMLSYSFSKVNSL